MPTESQMRFIKEQEKEAALENMLQAMADYGAAGRGDYTAKSPIARHEEPRHTVSVAYDQSIEEAQLQLEQERRVMNATTVVEHNFVCRKDEGIIAIKRVMEEYYQSTGLPVQQTMWGEDVVPPVKAIQVGLDPDGDPIYEDAPIDAFSLPKIGAEIYLSAWENDDQVELLQIRVEIKMRRKAAIEGFIRHVEDEIATKSIYKGKIMSYTGLPNGSYKLEFVHRRIDPIFTYNRSVEERLEQSMWRIIRHRKMYLKHGKQTTFKVLLRGPAGTGKTGAGITTMVLAVQNGQTVFEYNPTGLPTVRDLKRITELAKRLGPSLMFIEDYEKFFTDENGNDHSAYTYLVDGADKHNRISMVFTSNFPERIDPSMARGARMTDTIEIGMLDEDATRRLLQKVLGGKLDPDTDWDAVYEATKDFGPSFLDQCYQKASHVDLGLFLDAHGGSDEGYEGIIGTEGLIGAAESSDELIAFFNSLVAAREEKKPGFKEWAVKGVFSLLKESGHKIRLTNKGFSVVE